MGCNSSSLKGDFNAEIGGSSTTPSRMRFKSGGDDFLAGLDTSSEIKPTRSLSHGAYNTTTSDSTSGPSAAQRERKKSYNPFSSPLDRQTSSAEIHKDRHMSHSAYNTTSYDETATNPPTSPTMERKKSYPFNTGLEGSSEIHKERSHHGGYNTTSYDETAIAKYERPSYVATKSSAEIKKGGRWFGGTIGSEVGAGNYGAGSREEKKRLSDLEMKRVLAMDSRRYQGTPGYPGLMIR